MVKKNKRLIFLHQGEVILQPVVYIPLRVIGRVVSAVDGSNDIMHVADIERIPCRAINRFIKFFAVVAFHQVVVAYAVIDGAAHCLCIHYLIVHCESRFVTDVSGMNQESGLFILYILLKVSYPTSHSTGHFGIGDLNERMFPGFCPFTFS